MCAGGRLRVSRSETSAPGGRLRPTPVGLVQGSLLLQERRQMAPFVCELDLLQKGYFARETRPQNCNALSGPISVSQGRGGTAHQGSHRGRPHALRLCCAKKAHPRQGPRRDSLGREAGIWSESGCPRAVSVPRGAKRRRIPGGRDFSPQCDGHLALFV